jgi:hypothetical protein
MNEDNPAHMMRAANRREIRKVKIRKRCFRMALAGVLILAASGCLQRWASEDKTPRMTKEELRTLLGSPNVALVDVRIEDDWKKSELKIQGAVRENPEKDVRTWANRYPKDKTLIFY